jgi:hypothetical protein
MFCNAHDIRIDNTLYQYKTVIIDNEEGQVLRVEMGLGGPSCYLPISPPGVHQDGARCCAYRVLTPTKTVVVERFAISWSRIDLSVYENARYYEAAEDRPTMGSH